MTEGIEIRREALAAPAARQMIEALNAELKAEYPGEGETFFRLDADEVAGGQGAFLVAYAAGRPVGCGAIRKLDDESAEIKRMYVDRAARGRGLGRQLLVALEEEASRLGVRRVVLETGPRQFSALALYESFGFKRIPAFGDYVNSPISICMAKSI